RLAILFAAVFLWIEHQSAVYDQTAAVLWQGQLESRLPLQLQRALAFLPLIVGTSIALLGPERVLGSHAHRAVRDATRYLGLLAIGYAVAYLISPGYVFTIYLSRTAPLGVFLFDTLIAVVAYGALAAARNLIVSGFGRRLFARATGVS